MDEKELAVVRQQAIGKTIADLSHKKIEDDSGQRSIFTIKFTDQTQIVFGSVDASGYFSAIVPEGDTEPEGYA